MSRQFVLSPSLAALALALLALPAPATDTLKAAAAEAAPSLDGTIGDDEWAGAHRVPMSPRGELLAQTAGGVLWLAQRGESPILGSLCLANEEKVVVLHASAALSSAVYRRGNEGGWRLERGFSWCCRQGGDELAALIAEEGWGANVVHDGTPGEMEYRIDVAKLLGDGPVHFAAVALDFDAGELLTAPAGLDDGCADDTLVRGETPETERFAPESWYALPRGEG